MTRRPKDKPPSNENDVTIRDHESRLCKLEKDAAEIVSLLRELRSQGARAEERETRDTRNVAYLVGHPSKY